MDTIILFTCHNRKKLTEKCIYSIDDPSLDMSYIAVDDGSTDGTADMLRKFGEERNREITILEGSGSLYWAGGMRKGMQYIRANKLKADYLLLINDDVEFNKDAIRQMLELIKTHPNSCITGAMCDEKGGSTYGGVRYDMSRAKDRPVDIHDKDLKCDAANMNAFLMPYEAFIKAGPFDPCYKHAMADYDYSFELRRQGYAIYMTDHYVGKCRDNDIKGSWRDTTLPRIERIRRKESNKGLPAGDWYHYLRKNFGLRQAIWHSITPYIRILIGK